MALEVLVVDDEADIRELVSGVLEDEGYAVRTAADSSSALDAIEDRRDEALRASGDAFSVIQSSRASGCCWPQGCGPARHRRAAHLASKLARSVSAGIARDGSAFRASCAATAAPQDRAGQRPTR